MSAILDAPRAGRALRRQDGRRPGQRLHHARPVGGQQLGPGPGVDGPRHQLQRAVGSVDRRRSRPGIAGAHRRPHPRAPRSQDAAITAMRRILLESARRLAAGQAPLSDPRTIDYPAIRPVMGMVTKLGSPQARRPGMVAAQYHLSAGADPRPAVKPGPRPGSLADRGST